MSSCPGGGWSVPTGESLPETHSARLPYSAPRASSSEAGVSSPPPSAASPSGVAAAAADFTLTNAMRMLARASRNVGVSGPSRSPSPSTRAPTASIASEAPGRSGGDDGEVDRGQLVQAHHMVGDDDLGGHLGEPPAGILDGLLGVTEHRLGVVGRGILSHVSYPSGAISKRSGGDPHPATTACVRPGPTARLGGVLRSAPRASRRADTKATTDHKERSAIAQG